MSATASSPIHEMIAKAIAAGKVTRVPVGVSAKECKPAKSARVRFHPDHCSKGGRNDRHRFLDEIDGDFK